MERFKCNLSHRKAWIKYIYRYQKQTSLSIRETKCFVAQTFGTAITFSTMTFSTMAFSTMAFSTMAFSTMTLNIKSLLTKLSINGTA
jgi:hypothetical protein